MNYQRRCCIILSSILALLFTHCTFEQGPTKNESAEVLPAVSLFSHQVDSATSEKHAIDLALEDCFAKEASNLHIRKCLAEAFQQWDDELNVNYKALRTKLQNQGQKDALKASQLEWIKFRDLEFAFIESQFEGLEGSMYPNLIIRYKLEITRQRALGLKTYVDFHEIHFE